MIFKYKAISQTGEIIEGYYESEDETSVLTMLKQNDYIPVTIEKDEEVIVKKSLISKRIKKKDIAIFCRQFYTMLNAGVSIVNGLEILGNQTPNKSFKKAIDFLYEDVQKGITLSESMAKHTDVFPTLLISMVEAGEVSGNLDVVMERMAHHYEKEYKLENKVKSALIYPIVLSVVSVLVVVFLLVFVMPTFIDMFSDSGVELPIATRLLLFISSGLKEYWYLFMVALLGLSLGIQALRKSRTGRYFIDRGKIKIPVLKSIIMTIITARFTRTMSTLMSSGIPLMEVMEIVGRVVGNKVIEDKLLIASDEIRRGVPLSRTIGNIDDFPPMVYSMIKIGEETGSLDDILVKTADYYDEESEVALTKLTTLMEPLLIVLMAIIIGFIVIAIALPMFDMMQTI